MDRDEAMSAQPVTLVPIDFTVGSRRLLSVERQLSTWAFSLEEALATKARNLTVPPPGPDGFRILSAPLGKIPEIEALCPHHVIGARQDYPRHYIAMDGFFDDYMAHFSGKTRSTLRRKARKLEKEVGAGYTITEHRTPAEIEDFLAKARPLSAKTYQARLLDAGLPDTPEATREMMVLAEQDRIRGYLLKGPNGPIAYLLLPVQGKTIVYAHLGYDPDWARLSPGTLLQMEALERLFAEQRYQYFDFTEGDGAHKAMFGTHSVACASFMLLSPTLANRALIASRGVFDTGVAAAKSLAERSGALAGIRSRLRA